MQTEHHTPAYTRPANLCTWVFLAIGFLFILKSSQGPIRDFGNYYYGSKLLTEGKFDKNMYDNLEYFNRQAAAHDEADFFGNYIPVPPFSALFYLPFCAFKSAAAKLVFNILSLLLFCFSLRRLLNYYRIHTFLLLVLPVVFLSPLQNNILQGQAYLLLFSLMVEALLAHPKKVKRS